MSRVALCAALAVAISGCGQEAGTARQAASAVAPDEIAAQDLRRAVSDPRARRFYEARGWEPAWTEARAEELATAIGEAESHAISSSRLLGQASRDGSPAEREAALTLAALSYADALANGTVDPRQVWDLYEIPIPQPDLAKGLAAALEEGEVGAWLAGLAPADEEYRALSQAYLAYKSRVGQGGSLTVGAGETIHEGDKDPRVPQIADALMSNGYLEPAAAPPADPTLYTPDIAKAVARLQADYGIDSDGVVGASTLEALNTGPVERARILAVNLERRRWLVRTLEPTRIDVNTAAAFLDYWREGALAHRARVVVGQPEWETPQIASPLQALVANPPWTVPESIAEKEILPKGWTYMRSNDMTMRDGRIVQAPGPKSALGLVKFDLANAHAIYLHDTPAKALFATNRRHASHGCARVHGAVEFARLVAQHDGKLDDFDKALAKGEEKPVALSAKIPVRFLYHTAYLDGGRIVFRTDPYGWDDQLAAALGLGGQVRRRIRTQISDAGP